MTQSDTLYGSISYKFGLTELFSPNRKKVGYTKSVILRQVSGVSIEIYVVKSKASAKIDFCILFIDSKKKKAIVC